MALALQTTLAGLRIGGTTAVNLVLVVVVYGALSFGRGRRPGDGTVGGLMQDALAGGIVGIGGFAKTLVGFLVGWLGAQFIVSQPLPRFVMFVAATILHEACTQALYAVVESRGLPPAVFGDADPGLRQRPGRRAGLPVRGTGSAGPGPAPGAQRQPRAAALLRTWRHDNSHPS